MMNTKMVKKACIIIALGVLSLVNSAMAHCQIVTVSVPALNIARNERIVGFEIHVRSGRIALLPNIPIGWHISIDNDPSWNTMIKGSIDVGAAAVDPSFLRDFIVVEVERDAPADMPFSLQGEITVTSDFISEKRIKLSMKNFVIRGGRDSKVAPSH